MDGNNQKIIDKLKALKLQGLTFYQATEQLKQQGYTTEQISTAADQFNYSKSTTAPMMSTTNIAQNQLPSISFKSYEKLGNAILADKERSTRPFAYVSLVIPCGYLGLQIYRFWLNHKFWATNDPRYLWANNLGWVFLSAAIGGAIGAIGLKTYFYSKDKHYKEIDKRIDNGLKY